jgi:hypothetical protein
MAGHVCTVDPLTGPLCEARHICNACAAGLPCLDLFVDHDCCCQYVACNAGEPPRLVLLEGGTP